MVLHTKYQGSRPRFFHVTPRAGYFGPNKLGRGLLGDNTYQISRLDLGLMVSGKKIFSCFPNEDYVKRDRSGRAIFGPRSTI